MVLLHASATRDSVVSDTHMADVGFPSTVVFPVQAPCGIQAENELDATRSLHTPLW